MNYSKLYKCRAAALPRLERLMEAIDPDYFWSIQESPGLTSFLMDRRNNSWGNDPTPAQQLALNCFRQEVLLRGSKTFQFELYGQLYELDETTGKASKWVCDEKLLKWDREDLSIQDFIRLQEYHSQHFGKDAEDARAKRSQEDWKRLQDGEMKRPAGKVEE